MMRYYLIAFVLCLFTYDVSAQENQSSENNETMEENKQLPKATKQQVAEWLSQHIVAWDENRKLEVDGKDCRLQILRSNRSAIMNFKGILFPVEVIRKGNSNDAYVRVRFKDRYSGDYGMERECNQQNNFCKDNIGKWSPLSYFDFTVTHVNKYSGPNLSLNISKANRLASAISHYARLCNATDYNFRF